MHSQQASDALPVAGARIVEGGSGLKNAGVDTDVNQSAYVLVRYDLEDEHTYGVIDRRLSDEFRSIRRVSALDGRDIKRGGKVVDDCVKQGLDAAVFKSGATHHRRDLEIDRGLAQRCCEDLVGDLLIAQVSHEKVFVGF